jgi:hypothetical protein
VIAAQAARIPIATRVAQALSAAWAVGIPIVAWAVGIPIVAWAACILNAAGAVGILSAAWAVCTLNAAGAVGIPIVARAVCILSAAWAAWTPIVASAATVVWCLKGASACWSSVAGSHGGSGLKGGQAGGFGLEGGQAGGHAVGGACGEDLIQAGEAGQGVPGGRPVGDVVKGTVERPPAPVDHREDRFHCGKVDPAPCVEESQDELVGSGPPQRRCRRSERRDVLERVPVLVSQHDADREVDRGPDRLERRQFRRQALTAHIADQLDPVRAAVAGGAGVGGVERDDLQDQFHTRMLPQTRLQRERAKRAKVHVGKCLTI